MRKFVCFLLIVACTAICVVGLHAQNRLSNLPEDDQISAELVNQGQIAQVVQTPAFWMGFPRVDLTHWQKLIHMQAAILVIVLLAVILPILRNQKRTSYLTAGVISLLFGLVPLVAGQYMLLGNDQSSRTTFWLGFMIVGLIYTTLVAFGFVALELGACMNKDRHKAKAKAKAS